jgi:hypothetical protein
LTSGSGQLHALGALHPGKQPIVPTEQEAEWAPEPVWTLWSKEKSLLLPEPGVLILGFSYFTYFYTNNAFITTKFIVFYMSDLNFITVARLFNVCCRSEMKMGQRDEDFTAKEW